ncbi:hypothetical protein BDW75DRAFT_56813 [Aspergillus navahoensis]
MVICVVGCVLDGLTGDGFPDTSPFYLELNNIILFANCVSMGGIFHYTDPRSKETNAHPGIILLVSSTPLD